MDVLGIDVGDIELFGALFVPEDEGFDLEMEGGGRERVSSGGGGGAWVVGEEVEVEGAAEDTAGPGEREET